MEWIEFKDVLLQGLGVWIVYELRRLRESVELLNIEMAKKETSDEDIKRRVSILEDKIL
jgi:hypothetical protein